ncbi:MAG: dephospho-CoA kinase [Arachidicoccus sp.]|nr:dephospho-CoA kinase [Arachidicoccus sp.]
MLKIGITGGIGSGKTTVAHIFHTLGIPVFNADTTAKEIVTRDKKVQTSLIRNFGKEVFANGELNKKYLADIVFKNSQKLNLLNSIIHPATIKASNDWMKKQKAPYAIKEAALLFEAKTTNNLDAIIGIYAPLEIRINRVIARNHISRDEVLMRIGKQMDEDQKMNLCDYVIYNDDKSMVIPQVLELHRQFTKV